ncbi:MAG: vWA domain-containing protein [Phycisphaerae bacterium]
MRFLHAWMFFFGALAVGLPILIHYLTRPRPVRLPLSTIRFVQEVIHQRRTFHRLRNFLILALRTLAVGLLAWAFTRPLIGEKPLIGKDDSASAVRVVILDVSQSMAASLRGISVFERARSVGAEYLAHRAGLRANLILAGARARPIFEQCSANVAALKDELSQTTVLPERLNVQAAIAVAAEMLSTTSGDGDTRRELIIVSDFQRSNWASVDFSPLPSDTVIELEAAGPAEVPPNVAILRVGVQGRPERDREVRMDVEVGNYSSLPRRVTVDLQIGEATYRLEGLCPPGISTTLSGPVTLRGSGWQVGRAVLPGLDDALPADDHRDFAVEVRPRPTYALVSRQRPDDRPSSSYYLERGLAPLEPKPGQAVELIVRIPPDQLSREALASAELIALDHPGPLSAEAAGLLAAMMRRGRAILYVAAEPVDASNLKRIVDAAGSDLQMPVEFVPPAPGQVRQNLFLAEVRAKDPPFNVFGDQVAAAIGPLRFAGGLVSRRTESALAEDLLATYSDRTACLVSTVCGAGHLTVLNADLSESNLPRSPAFVPLIGELVSRMLGQNRAGDAVPCGEPLAMHLPADSGTAAGLQIVGPKGAGDFGELATEGTWTVWRWPAAGAPGVYEVQREGKTVFAAATGIAAQESDLTSLSESIFKDRLAGGRTVHYRNAATDQNKQDDIWLWFAAACVACLCIELMVLRLFRT